MDEKILEARMCTVCQGKSNIKFFHPSLSHSSHTYNYIWFPNVFLRSQNYFTNLSLLEKATTLSTPHLLCLSICKVSSELLDAVGSSVLYLLCLLLNRRVLPTPKANFIFLNHKHNPVSSHILHFSFSNESVQSAFKHDQVSFI